MAGGQRVYRSGESILLSGESKFTGMFVVGLFCLLYAPLVLTHVLSLVFLCSGTRVAMLWRSMFLDRFVRQNVAELDEIPFEEQECVVELPPAERAIYLELETYLNSLEMNGKSAQKSKRKSTGDRESRMQKVLQESDTAEEALLKSCSHFNLSSDTSTALETVDHIIRVRESEKRDLEKEMAAWLTAAFRQRQRVLDCQSNWLAVTSTAKGEMIDALGVFLKGVEAKASVPHGADEEINNRIQEIVRQAEALFDADPRPAGARLLLSRRRRQRGGGKQ